MRMIPALPIMGLLALTGCQSVQDYTPYIVEVKDPKIVVHDIMQCRSYAETHKSPLSLSSIGEAGIVGGLNNLPSAAISPLATGLGGVGQAGSEMVTELGFSESDKRKIAAICLFQKGLKSGAYMVIDPIL